MDTSFRKFLADQRGYRRNFFAAHGPGPWPCFFCSEPVTEVGGLGGRNLLVHHIDGDHSNDVGEKLATEPVLKAA